MQKLFLVVYSTICEIRDGDYPNFVTGLSIYYVQLLGVDFKTPSETKIHFFFLVYYSRSLHSHQFTLPESDQ